MKEERMLRALGEVDDDLIEDARHADRRIVFWRWGAVAAAALLLAVGVTLLPWEPQGGLPVTSDTPTRSDSPSGDGTADPSAATTSADQATTDAGHEGSTTASANTTAMRDPQPSTQQTEDSAFIMPHWEDRPLTSRFTEAIWQGVTYHIDDGGFPMNMVGEKLGTVTVQGYDIYTDTTHTTTVTLYRAEAINPLCAVAVQYPGQTDYHPARNWDYSPATLGDLIDDLSLRDTLEAGIAAYTYMDGEGKFHQVTTTVSVAKEDVWNRLLSDPTLPNVYDQQNLYVSYLTISIDVLIIGQENISLRLTEDGYLVTNILDSGKAFYIGEKAVQDFKKAYIDDFPLVEDTIIDTGIGDHTTDGDDDRGTVTQTTSARRPNTAD